MAEKITVKDFIEKYNGDLSALEIREYIPITEKRLAIEEMIKKIITEENLITTYDSIMKGIMFTLSSVCLYTNLTATTPEDYDVLCETKLLFDILNKADSFGDYEDFHNMFEMRMNDYMRDANTVMGAVNKIVGALKDVFENVNPEDLTKLLSSLEETYGA